MDTMIEVPWAPPVEGDVVHTIDSAAFFVSTHTDRNSAEETLLKNDSKFTNYYFLLDKSTSEYRYYLWKCQCFHHKLTESQQISIKNQYVENIIKCLPGTIDLLHDDKILLMKFLLNNNGTKDKIKAIRRWTLDRAHSMMAIGIIFHRFVDDQKSIPSSFQLILHTIYVINDILFNGSSAVMNGVYIKGLSTTLTESDLSIKVNIFSCLFQYLGSILNVAYHQSIMDEDREKLFKIIDLWVTKEFIDETQKNVLKIQMMNTTQIPVPPNPPLTSPVEIIRKIFHHVTSSSITNQYPSMILPTPIQDQNNFSSRGIQNPIYNITPRPPPPPPPPLPSSSLPQFHQPLLPQLPPQPQPQPYFYPDGNMHPNATFYPSPSIQQSSVGKIDLSYTSVGILANITKTSLTQGHPVYAPIDPHAIFTATSKPIEPGRLQVRVDEFYKKLNENRL